MKGDRERESIKRERAGCELDLGLVYFTVACIVHGKSFSYIYVYSFLLVSDFKHEI